MLIVLEKPSQKRKVIEALGDKITNDELITYFGSGLIDNIIPEGMPGSACSWEHLLKHGDLDEAMPFGTLDYLMAKAILGKDGRQFRELLLKKAKEHGCVLFFVEPDSILDVSKRLASELNLDEMDICCRFTEKLDSLDKATINREFDKALSD